MPPAVPESKPCPVCRTPATGIAPTGDGQEFQCPRCGLFYADGTLLERLERLEPLQDPQRAYASSWIRERAPADDSHGVPPLRLTSDHEPLLRSARPPSVAEQADRLLGELARRFPRPGQVVRVDFNDQALQAIAWAVDRDELHFLAATYLLYGKSFLIVHSSVPRVEATGKLAGWIGPDGWAYIQAGGTARSTSGFIAMWFHDSTNDLRDRGLKPAIVAAGYRPFLVNESMQNKPIDAEIIANIRRSRLLVADLHCGDDGARGGVYFEAGYAMGHGIPVFWTCHQEDLDRGKIHFDVRQYVFTPWGQDSWDIFVTRLSSFIEANEGAGPFKGLPAA